MLYPFILVILVSGVFSDLVLIHLPLSVMFRERKFHGTFVPGNESSTLWNFRSWERKFFGTKVPATLRMPVTVTLGRLDHAMLKIDFLHCHGKGRATYGGPTLSMLGYATLSSYCIILHLYLV